MKSARLLVKGMTCGGCANKLKESLKSVARGEVQVKVDLPAGEVLLDYEDQALTLSEIKAQVQTAGFTLVNVEVL